MNVRLFIADDHQVFIDGLSAMLSQQGQFTVIGSANNGIRLVEQALHLKPDVILTDIQMPGMDGIEATAKITAASESIKVIALTMMSESLYVRKMMEAGAYGYLLKTTDRQELVEVIGKVFSGEKHFDQRLLTEAMAGMMRTKRSAPLLTRRETEILSLIAKGFTDKEIAGKVFLSPLTVITHRKNILGKLGLKNKVELTRYAMENDLL